MNVAKHAQASKTDVSLDVGIDSVTLIVSDDGIGLTPTAAQTGGLGVRNIRDRATRLGGQATFSTCDPKGTEVRWVVPRSAAAR
jgi:signal transduction histidine kinase